MGVTKKEYEEKMEKIAKFILKNKSVKCSDFADLGISFDSGRRILFEFELLGLIKRYAEMRKDGKMSFMSKNKMWVPTESLYQFIDAEGWKKIYEKNTF
jgi:hypothetical protein